MDPPRTQIYGMSILIYEGLYVGVPWLMYEDGVIDMHLAYSRDGIQWNRPQDRTKVIRWPGGTLHTNVNAENGSLAITVKSPEGQTLTHSTSIVGDRLKTPVKLHGQPPQPGDTVSLEFTITNGDLYSFWWE